MGWFFLFFALLVEVYSFFGIRQLIHNWSPAWRTVFNWGWWLPMLITIILFLYLGSQRDKMDRQHIEYGFFFFCVAFAFIAFLPKVVFSLFHLAGDLVHAGRWVAFKLTPQVQPTGATGITRLQFFNQLGIAAGAFTMGSMLYGITRGKYNFRVEKAVVPHSELPQAFNGTRIVQISDAHLGSFGDHSFEELEEAVRIINDLKPDYVFFTGDLVNFFASEAEPWIETFSRIEARLGKYSILGNHDYADYYNWRGDNAGKSENMTQLQQVHRQMGFELLRNESRLLERNGEHIALLGMENWGRGFQQYGDLKKTMNGVEEGLFKILLSHDPSHFEEQVMGRQPIHLTLSGHTHGAQLGVEVPSLGIKLSPSRLIYKRWAGLYQEGKQYLYVNRGLGFIGFPGRVGMPPEITFIELQRA